jgi:hypothetical protein
MTPCEATFKPSTSANATSNTLVLNHLLTYDEAKGLEVELGIDLRAGGYGVWQA